MLRRRLGRALVLLAGCAACWSIVVMITGGGVWEIGGARISSRGPRNPALLAALSLITAWALGAPGSRSRTVTADYRWLVDLVARRLPRIPAPVVAALAAIAVVVVGFTEGAFVVGGSDSYGYVSQAHLWSIGVLRQEPALFRALAPEVDLEALAPLGYRLTVDGTAIAPTYSPGLPIVMAMFERLAGPRSVFWVVPIFGGLLVWATYLLGTRLFGRAVGGVAAVLVATSPPVLIQLTSAPMSDLAAAAWWTLAFALASSARPSEALGAGASAGMAILTRPNLVPVLVIVAAFLIVWLMASGRSRRYLSQQVLLFLIFVIPACLAIAVLNRVMWGSVLQSGYGSVSEFFSLSNVVANILIYPFVVARLMPVALLAPSAWFVGRAGWRARAPTIAMASWVVAVVLLYLPFPAYDSARNLRFLLPAVPQLFILATAGARALVGNVIARHAVACVLVLAAVCGFGVDAAREQGAFAKDDQRKYAAIGEYIARELPDQAVMLAQLHSGSATYYSGRPTLRYDLLPPSRLDRVVDVLKERGYVPYLLIDSSERAGFQARYRGSSRLAALDWSPLVTIGSPPVEIYSLGTSLAPSEP